MQPRDSGRGSHHCNPLVHAVGRDQRRGVDPEALQNVIPHTTRGDIEDHIRRTGSGQPRPSRQLRLQLPRAPTRVTQEELDRRWRRLRHGPEDIQRPGETDTTRHSLDFFEVGGQGIIPVEQHPPRIGLDRSTPVNGGVRIPPPSNVETDTQVAGGKFAGAIQHQAEAAFGIVLHQEHDGAPKIRVLELRHGNQKRGFEAQPIVQHGETRIATPRRTCSGSVARKQRHEGRSQQPLLVILGP